MNILATGIKNHICLESDIIPVTDSLITFQNINSCCLESDKMVIFNENLFAIVVDCYINQQLNCTEISNKIGIGKATICYWLKNNGIPRRDKNRQRKGKKRRAFTKQHCKNISKAKKGKAPQCAFRDKIGEKNPFFGRQHTKETCDKISVSHANCKKELNPNWKGGFSKSRSVIYKSISYKRWRKRVFERDNFTCQVCGDNRGHNLEAHHIRAFAICRTNPSLLYNIDNGMTLCDKCHEKYHKIFRPQDFPEDKCTLEENWERVRRGEV